MIAASSNGRMVPALACELAGRMSALFEQDVEIVGRLNVAQRRLQSANERLWSGLSPDAFGLVHDRSAPAGASQIAALMADARGAGGPNGDAAALSVLRETHWAIRSGFHAYQAACEKRRQLAFEVGELARQLTDVLCAAGWSADAGPERRCARARTGGDWMSCGVKEGARAWWRITATANHTHGESGT